MMELKGAFVELGGKVWLKRGLRLFMRCGSISNQKINNNHNAAAAEESGMLLQKGGGVVSCSWADEEEGERGGGVVRMKIVVRKSDLKHLVSTASTGVKAAATAQQRPTTRTTTMSCVNVKVPYPYSTAEQRLNSLIMYNACIIIFIIQHPPHFIIIFRPFHLHHPLPQHHPYNIIIPIGQPQPPWNHRQQQQQQEPRICALPQFAGTLPPSSSLISSSMDHTTGAACRTLLSSVPLPLHLAIAPSSSCNHEAQPHRHPQSVLPDPQLTISVSPSPTPLLLRLSRLASSSRPGFGEAEKKNKRTKKKQRRSNHITECALSSKVRLSQAKRFDKWRGKIKT